MVESHGDVVTGRARFDDAVAGSAQVFGTAEEIVATHRRQDVTRALDRVEAAVARGRWAHGFIAYEAAAGLDDTLASGPTVKGLPLVWFAITGAPVVEPVVEPPLDSRGWGPWRAEWDRTRYATAFDRVRSAIAAGDSYQCNLTTAMTSPFTGHPFELYRALVNAQGGKYNAYLDLGRFVVASASPELFFEVRGDRILMRPMKGTAPRGRTSMQDEAAIRRLLGSEKERAENIMIVDLVRNDVARIARIGSVRVPHLLRCEMYETVHQLTSDIEAQLDPAVGLTDIFRALFPCGSITGAPKRSTMALIEELEPSPRGVYCGAVGVLAPPGSEVRMRFSVAIRTVVADRVTGVATYGVGGGITWDSRADLEYDEMLTKAAVLDAREVE
ncbi:MULTISPECIES: aminodeoxychorismate synthase component I [unclassified Rhodococcus (in: high G+C Gram-positive bacteria)]|uniref:aminodeoxychorismate synthase component I n=1 Tax=unclassified Rhodococcus (in: high G+C Gram-positive bacteria) TaxID=192944 RepID=UPI00190FC6D8|nr:MULTISPECIES: aminodeoxychorismate synthase component I [unclassified Rhodococcus (in: high G+C Gram-positive bacteria)]